MEELELYTIMLPELIGSGSHGQVFLASSINWREGAIPVGLDATQLVAKMMKSGMDAAASNEVRHGPRANLAHAHLPGYRNVIHTVARLEGTPVANISGNSQRQGTVLLLERADPPLACMRGAHDRTLRGLLNNGSQCHMVVRPPVAPGDRQIGIGPDAWGIAGHSGRFCDLQTALAVMKQLAAGLHYLHASLGIAHGERPAAFAGP